MLHTIEFDAELFTTLVRQPVCLLVPRGVFLIEWFDEAVFDEPTNCSVQCAGAQAHTSAAEALDILDEGVAVAWFVCQAGQYQQHRLRQRLLFIASNDMSHGDILLLPIGFVNQVIVQVLKRLRQFDAVLSRCLGHCRFELEGYPLSHPEMVDDRCHSFGFLRKLHSTFPLSLRIDDAR